MEGVYNYSPVHLLKGDILREVCALFINSAGGFMNGKNKKDIEKLDDSYLLESMLNATNDAIVFVDGNGFIVKMSNAYGRYLNIDAKTAVGKHITEVIENTRMHKVLQTGVAEIAQTQQIGGQTMIATRIPLKKNGKVVGAFGRVIFKSLVELKNFNKNIDRLERTSNLYKNKFKSLSSARYSIDDIIGESLPIKALKYTIKKVAQNKSSVLILGESGTGKELVAHAIHASSSRAEKPLICINCASIPSELMESEFFGYEEGAFTGARKGGKIGLFQAADKGTIFLDEIGDLPMNMQVKLLRVLQEKEIRPVGSNVSRPVNVRIITATNKNLEELVKKGRFRDDLYYRLNVVTINVPPLRERMEDLSLITGHIINNICEKNDIIIEGITNNAMNILMQYNWPGNIRELENVLERSSNFMTSDRTIHRAQIMLDRDEQDLPTHMKGDLKSAVEDFERRMILTALKRNSGMKSQTAKDLSISRTSLYEKLEKYKLK